MAPTPRSRRHENDDDLPPALRQSPPRLLPAAAEKEPHWRLLPAAAEKEPHSNLSCKQPSQSAIRRITNPRTRPYHSRRCKRGISITIDSLPDELLFDILSRVPADDIHQNARLVCRRWKQLIHGDGFAQAHLHHAGDGLLISRGHPYHPIFMAATRAGGIEVSKLCLKSEYVVQASCNGLILVTFDNSLYIVNPATRDCFKLPEFYGKKKLSYFSIAYAAASMKYKVVATYRYARCAILTVGVDKTWRGVAIEHLLPKANQFLLHNPLITEGFMHWFPSLGNDVLTLNVEAEVFALTPAPLPPHVYISGDMSSGECVFIEDQYSYLSTGRHLSVLISHGKLFWEVWEMKVESGEWRKVLPDIDLRAHEHKIKQLAMENDVLLVPFGWVKFREVLLFVSDQRYRRVERSYIIYNLVNDEVEDIGFQAPSGCCKPLVHKKSLACLS